MNSSAALNKPEQKEDKQSNSKAIFTKSLALRKHENIHGNTFISLPDNETIAFIQGVYDNTHTRVTLWHVPTDTKTELIHKKSADIISEIQGLALSHDGNYLIASTTREIDDDLFVELLVWDLKNKILHPIYQLTTALANKYLYRSSIVTENNILMIQYVCTMRKWVNIVATYEISNKGTLHPLNVVTLNPKSFFAALSPKNYIFDVPQASNQLNVRDFKGTVLETYYLKSANGKLKISRTPLNSKVSESLYSLCQIDKHTLSLVDRNESVYILDVTNVHALKQIAYVSYDEIGTSSNIKSASFGQVQTIPMNIETGLVLIENKGTILFYHLQEKMILGAYKLGYQENYDITFKGAVLNNQYLVCSQYEEQLNEYKAYESISVFQIDLLEELRNSKLAKEILSDAIKLPHVLSGVVESYLVGSNYLPNPNRLFSKSYLQPLPAKICGKRSDRDSDDEVDQDMNHDIQAPLKKQKT